MHEFFDYERTPNGILWWETGSLFAFWENGMPRCLQIPHSEHRVGAHRQDPYGSNAIKICDSFFIYNLFAQYTSFIVNLVICVHEGI